MLLHRLDNSNLLFKQINGELRKRHAFFIGIMKRVVARHDSINQRVVEHYHTAQCAPLIVALRVAPYAGSLIVALRIAPYAGC